MHPEPVHRTIVPLEAYDSLFFTHLNLAAFGGSANPLDIYIYQTKTNLLQFGLYQNSASLQEEVSVNRLKIQAGDYC